VLAGPDRPVSVSRELTKKFETTWRGTLSEATTFFAGHEPRGEFVVVLRGADEQSYKLAASAMEPTDVRARLDALRAQGMRTRDAVDAVTDETGLPRRQVYAIATAPA
jgi:16S rRNA (cytidine1402-2'-O)-methyltransferase